MPTIISPSTLDQEPENQLVDLRRYVEARGWTATESPTPASRSVQGLLNDSSRKSMQPMHARLADREAGTFS